MQLGDGVAAVLLDLRGEAREAGKMLVVVEAELAGKAHAALPAPRRRTSW